MVEEKKKNNNKSTKKDNEPNLIVLKLIKIKKEDKNLKTQINYNIMALKRSIDYRKMTRGKKLKNKSIKRI